MGKMKKAGVNDKAVSAKERKQATVDAAKEKSKKAADDASWQDNDKHALKKTKKAAENECKKAAAAQRKREASQLLLEEEKSIKSKDKKSAGGNTSKKTQAQISAEKEKDQRLAADERIKASNAAKKLVAQPDVLVENTNKARAEIRAADEDAHGVDEALQILSVSDASDDANTVSRKAAYMAFEEVNLPILRAENKGMRLQQVKQMLWKQWLRSLENPSNQQS